MIARYEGCTVVQSGAAIVVSVAFAGWLVCELVVMDVRMAMVVSGWLHEEI